MNPTLSAFVSRYKDRTEQKLNQLFDNISSYDAPLIAAMRYSLLDGGKRIRPMLAYAAAHAIRGSEEPIDASTDAAACAIECIHVYSLIHDDLPAMDDDDLRRGKATCHIAFDEATAILAGDALQALAFEILGKSGNTQAVVELAKASGMQGMVIGQAIDLNAVDSELSLEQLETMHRHKTGAIIEASVTLGALSAGANGEQIDALRHFSRAIGLAFQVQDDILDVTADTETLGKPQGADIRHNKPTYVSLLGLEQAREKVIALHKEALAALGSFGKDSEYLAMLANYVVEREH